MSRQFQKQDVEYIQKLRATLQDESELSTNIPENRSMPDDSCLDQFHNEILKHSRILSVKLGSSAVVAKSKDAKEHTLYQIMISADQLNYQVKRRYRQFYELYKKIRKYFPNNLVFPRKNYNPFVSSTSQAIIHERCPKLNQFLQAIFVMTMNNQQPFVSLCFFNFLELKENYEHHYKFINHYAKSSSEKITYNKINTLKPIFSLNNFSKLDQNSIQSLIVSINQKQNSGKQLEKLEDFIKNKKLRATNQQITLIFLGFNQYNGLLHFGFNNYLESNRIKALGILIDLITPQNNIHFQKYERIIQKVPLQLWVVKNMSFFENSAFKILYFKLLRIYCEKMQKQNNITEANIFKKLFLFHEDLIVHYFQWKKLNTIHQFDPIYSQNAQIFQNIQHSQSIEVLDLEDDRNELQTMRYVHKQVEICYMGEKNIVILKLQSTKSIKEITKTSFKWNRLIEAYNIEEYTGLYRYLLSFNSKQWNLRLKIDIQELQALQEKNIASKLISSQFQQAYTEIITSSTLKISKRQQPFEICPQLEEQIWVRSNQKSKDILVALKVVRDIDLFEGSLKKWCNMLAEDAANFF